MRRWTALVPLTLLWVSGCLASKGDIRLLQDEFRATRSQLGVVDTSMSRANEQRRQQIATLSASVDRLTDSLRVLNNRFASFQSAVSSELTALNDQMVRTQALLGQTTRNLQDTRAQLEAMRDAAASAAPLVTAAATDPNRAPGVPSAVTLLTSGREQLSNGAYGTARAAFEQLLTSYPNADEAPKAQLYIGETYAGEGNTAAADSVYQLIPTKYPKSADAGTALYRHGKLLCRTNKKGEGRLVLNKVIRDFPNSDEARLAKDC